MLIETISASPPEVPVVIDHQLLVEAETHATGANIHNVKSLLWGYRMAIDLIQEGKDVDGRLRRNLESYADDLRHALLVNRSGVRHGR